MTDQELIANIQSHIRRHNQLFFTKNDPFLADLNQAFNECDHKTLIIWALKNCDIIIDKLSVDPTDLTTVINAYDLCERWAKGETKMPHAKAEILKTHAIAKRLSDPVMIALIHAIGQGLSVVHTPKHALGLPIYELSAIVYAKGATEAVDNLHQRKNEYLNILAAIKKDRPFFTNWAAFIR